MAHIHEIFKAHPTTFSFEFFPPKDRKGADRLFEHIVQLEALRPAFVSITYGAGGSTRDLTTEIVHRTREQTGLNTVPHLTCVNQTTEEIDAILEEYVSRKIRNILALRGDAPNDKDHDWGKEQFKHASDLVARIRNFRDSHGVPGGFGIGIAGFPEGHPDTPNRLIEMDFLKAKVDAGADFIITQMFFDNHDFYDFRERCELAGIHVPIIAGIMPVQSVKGMKRMADLARGMHFPAPLLRAIRRTDGSDEAIKRIGVHWATEQSRDLLDNSVRGIHFYTLNSSSATMDIYKTLGVRDSGQLGAGATLPF